jgi:hypothetical protein
MFTKLLQVLFVPKRARTKMAARRQAPAPASVRRDAPPPLSQSAYETSAGGRDKLLSDTMAVYRQQRQDVYDTLDDATKRQIEEDAEKAFGRILDPKG